MLSSPGVATSGRLRTAVESMGNQTIRLRKLAFVEESDEFWESQESALAEAIGRAVGRADPIQVRAYLDAINKPLKVLRLARDRKVVRDAYGECVRRGYDFLRLYVVALDEILAAQERDPHRRAKNTYVLGRVLLKSIWEETRDILRDVDYHTMELFTWLAPQMYRSIKDAGEKAGPLRDMRAEFGGFYEFADGWLERVEPKDTKAIESMRLVLHDGLTKWLLTAIAQKDGELTEQLCDAARVIVFGRKGTIAFEPVALVVRHFVLAGYLIGHAQADDIKVAAIARLFGERYSNEPRVRFDDLAAFYRANRFPHQTVDAYLRIFYRPRQTTTAMLTGSSYSAGFGMTGQHEMARAFIYLGACALAESMDEPQIISEDMSFELKDDAIRIVEDAFGEAHLNRGIDRLRAWRDRCKEQSGEVDAKAIADATLDQSQVEKWRTEFWKAYSASSPVLSLCLRNGNYEIVSTARTGNLTRLLPKIAVIDWKYPISGAGGNDYGRELAAYTEGQLLATMITRARTASQVKGTLSDLVKRAAAWLKKAGCEGEKGMIVAMTKEDPDSDLFRENGYVPSWREDVQFRGFEGFYEGFPIVWYAEKEVGEEGNQEREKPHRERVVAVDLRGWRGIAVRESLAAEGRFGELTIRTWTEEEIREALESKKLQLKEVNRAKGNCPVDISLHWELSSSPPPHARAFQLQVPEGGLPPEDRSRPTEQQEAKNAKA